MVLKRITHSTHKVIETHKRPFNVELVTRFTFMKQLFLSVFSFLFFVEESHQFKNNLWCQYNYM